MKKLGQYLVEKGWLTVPQAKQALQHQRVFGGRLGTCLLELNLLSEDRLTRALSELISIPPAPVDALRNIDESARDLLPARMACKSRVVVFEAYATEASVCILDAKDLLLQDEIAFVVSKRLKFHVAPEVRIYEALDRFYDCDIEARYHRIWDRLNRARYLWQEERDEAAASDEPEPVGTRGGTVWTPEPPPDFQAPREPSEVDPGGPGIGGASPVTEPSPPPAVAGPTVTDGPEVASVPEPSSAPAGPAPQPTGSPDRAVSETGSTRPIDPVSVPADPEALREAMQQAADRDRIASLLLWYLRERFDRVLLFMVRAGEVVGWMGAGPDVEQDRLDELAVEFEGPSLFLNLREGSPFFRGALARMDAHRDLVAILGDHWPKDCLAVPIRVKDRLVGVAYADQNGDPMEDVDMGEIQQVGSITGRAFEEFLLRRKKEQHH